MFWSIICGIKMYSLNRFFVGSLIVSPFRSVFYLCSASPVFVVDGSLDDEFCRQLLNYYVSWVLCLVCVLSARRSRVWQSLNILEVGSLRAGKFFGGGFC